MTGTSLLNPLDGHLGLDPIDDRAVDHVQKQPFKLGSACQQVNHLTPCLRCIFGIDWEMTHVHKSPENGENN